MKVIYILCAYATVYLIYIKFKATYDSNHDTFRMEFLVVPVGGLAFLVNHDFTPLEVGSQACMLILSLVNGTLWAMTRGNGGNRFSCLREVSEDVYDTRRNFLCQKRNWMMENRNVNTSRYSIIMPLT